MLFEIIEGKYWCGLFMSLRISAKPHELDTVYFGSLSFETLKQIR